MALDVIFFLSIILRICCTVRGNNNKIKKIVKIYCLLSNLLIICDIVLNPLITENDLFAR